MPSYDYISQFDAAEFARRYLALTLDPWQVQAVHPLQRRGVLNCCRQSGKTTALALRALHHLLFRPHAEVLIVSATEAQAGELFHRVETWLAHLGEDTRRLRARSFGLTVCSTGARLRALPCRQRALRGYTATMVILDEAAEIPDDVYHSLAGTLSATWDRADLWLASTPRERRGFFYRHCVNPPPGVLFLSVTAQQCPRITPAALAALKREFSPVAFAQNYECQFGDAEDAVFRDADILAARADDRVPALHPNRVKYLGRYPDPSFFLNLDLAKLHDYCTISLIEHRAAFLGQHPESRADLFRGELWLRWLQRLPLGLDYHDLVRVLRNLLSYPELDPKHTELAYDRTVAGVVFHDFLEKAGLGVRLAPIVFTTGHEAHQTNGIWHVPKTELVNTTQFAFRHRLVKISPDCPFVPELLDEMRHYRRIVTLGGRETFAGCGNSPDDLVTSVFLGVWRAFQRHKGPLLRPERAA